MITKVLSWLAGGGIAAIGKELNRAYQARLNAKNDEERIEADKQIAVLEARQAVLLAEQGSWMTRWIRPPLRFPSSSTISKSLSGTRSWDLGRLIVCRLNSGSCK